ncbi:MAG: hypothetical protein IKE08_04985 [Clostridia bacterium]|nr:hypothetical protein [Clostridia bacterium]MBR0387202.1 hypothetical protein [Clostridia bacterium]MBR2602032.1 hypothetical protein [Clostridia bacterium]MBR7174916.1 hypothetical protein [Clostridia bacterium]
MLLLKAEKHNWGLVGPGTWEKIKWKIEDTGWYQYTKTYRSGDDGIAEIPRLTVEGQLSSGQMETLSDLLGQEWNSDRTDACDGTAWEFKLYDHDTVIKHRPLDYIYDIEPYESLAALLQETEEE